MSYEPIYAELMRLLGLRRIADAVYGDVRLPLLVVDEEREWPWEAPVRIVSTGAVVAAIRRTGDTRPLRFPLEIDGRSYFLISYSREEKIDTVADSVAVWELATALRARTWIPARDAWEEWHFPRPGESGLASALRLRGFLARGVVTRPDFERDADIGETPGAES